MTEYCRKKGTNRIFIQTPYLMARGDMEPCEGPGKVLFPIDMKISRIAQIIPQISVEDYAKAGYGRPAMPKVSQISDLLGFKVKVEEIIEAMELVK